MPRKKSETRKVVKQVREHSREEEPAVESSRLLIPTGSTMLNLAVSDQARGGYGGGKIVNLVGDSNSGKTIEVLSGLMEMSLDDFWENWRFIYDDAESALEMDVRKVFGPKLADRIVDPWGTPYGDPDFGCSETVEDFKNNVWNTFDDDSPFVYILDSYDGMTSREEIKRQQKEAKGEEMNRDFPRQPAILNEALRKCKTKLRKTDSVLIVVSQTRDVMNPGTFGAQKRRAGGKGLKFFSSHEMWMAIKGQIKRTVRGKKRTIGHDVVIRSHRSKLTGKRRDIEVPIYTDYGVDDIGSMINWLMSNKVWTGTKSKVNTKGFMKAQLSVEDLITKIESDNGWLEELKDEVQDGWNVIEECLKVDRKKRYE